VGYLWSSEVAGYSIRYASKLSVPGGGERIILITDRRLGKTNDVWTPATGTPSTSDFSVIELRLDAKEQGEGKIALTGKVAPDATAKMVAPENYTALPVVLKDVKPRSLKPAPGTGQAAKGSQTTKGSQTAKGSTTGSSQGAKGKQ
jgi:hypothetical protein